VPASPFSLPYRPAHHDQLAGEGDEFAVWQEPNPNPQQPTSDENTPPLLRRRSRRLAFAELEPPAESAAVEEPPAEPTSLPEAAPESEVPSWFSPVRSARKPPRPPAYDMHTPPPKISITSMPSFSNWISPTPGPTPPSSGRSHQQRQAAIDMSDIAACVYYTPGAAGAVPQSPVEEVLARHSRQQRGR
jgi:hypothetical protein